MKQNEETRRATVERRTRETDITLSLAIPSLEESAIQSGVPFFDHMLSAMTRHGRFHMNLQCDGDYEVDDHHSVEDIGLCLGKALKEALGEKRGITRFGDATVPMDDALATVAIDLSGRPFFRYEGMELQGYVGRYSEELTPEFLRSMATTGEMNLHVKVHYGSNRHHIHEAIFKALGIALYKAMAIDPFLQEEILSTKGTIV